jgi:hypothetical protein
VTSLQEGGGDARSRTEAGHSHSVSLQGNLRATSSFSLLGVLPCFTDCQAVLKVHVRSEVFTAAAVKSGVESATDCQSASMSWCRAALWGP